MPTTIKITETLACQIAAKRETLSTLPAHVCPNLRACVVVARNGRKRPAVFVRYHSEAVGSTCYVDGYDAAIVAADVTEPMRSRLT